MVFSARSDWLLKLGIVSAIHLPTFFWISRASFLSFLRKKKELFGARHPLVGSIDVGVMMEERKRHQERGISSRFLFLFGVFWITTQYLNSKGTPS